MKLKIPNTKYTDEELEAKKEAFTKGYEFAAKKYVEKHGRKPPIITDDAGLPKWANRKYRRQAMKERLRKQKQLRKKRPEEVSGRSNDINSGQTGRGNGHNNQVKTEHIKKPSSQESGAMAGLETTTGSKENNE